MTYGSPVGDGEVSTLLGLDSETGEVRYERSVRSTWATNLLGWQYNGRYLITHWGCGLYATDPASGEEVWRIGGR